MHTNYYTGIVENRDDPLKLGRCQVRVFGVHTESLDDVPTSALPWALPLMPITSASLSGIGHSPTGPVNGTMVLVYFQDGESKQMPIMMGTLPGIPQNQNSGLKSGVLEESFKLNGSSSAPEASQTSPVTTSDGSNLVTSDGAPVTTGEPSTTTSGVGKMSSEWTSSSLTRCLELVKKFEGFKDKPYKDSVNVSTIGYGTTIYPDGKKVMMSDPVVTKDRALTYVKHHMVKNVFPYIASKVTVPITESMFESLCSFVYNIDGGNFSKSTLLQLLNDKNYKGAQEQFKEWTKAGGQVLRGLVLRRTDEAALFGADGYPDGTKTTDEPTATKPTADPAPMTDSTGTPVAPSSSEMNEVILDANSLGFKDVNRKYPLKSLLNEPDPNRLFRRVSRGTQVDKKLKRRRAKMQSPDGKVSFAEPKPPYNTTYPYNRGFATESGHLFEFDDTPGSERINLYHTSGTYSEIDAFGTQVNKIVGDGYTIIERNGYVYIDGTARIIVGSDVKLSVSGNLDVTVSGNMNFSAGGDINFKTPRNIQTNSGSKTSIRADANLVMDGLKTYINSDKSSSTSAYEQLTPVALDYEVQTPESFFDGQVMELEETDDAVVEEFYKEAISSGQTSQTELDKGVVEPAKKDEEPAPSKETLPKSCEMFTSDTIPDSLQISKYFTIGSVSSNAAVSRYQIAAQRGLTKKEIACNLKMLAENCLDVIRTQYPNAFITSGFRAGSGTSQHELGQAADIQFKGASKADYYEIAQWIKNNVPFDKLLLEYKTTGTGMPWIHIAYRENPRKEVYTFMNHSKKANGLADLSKA